MSLTTTRPSTSKPRGICRYYTHPRGCYAADKCKFLHAEPPIEVKPDDPPLLTPYDKAKRCRFYAQGFCKRGDSCWFLHVSDRKTGENTLSEDEDEELCSICFEKPVTFGLLGGCSHIFCITCIKQWRDPKNKPGGVLESGNTKKCPMCRASTNFITPSSKFWKAGTKEKDDAIKSYKESMSRVLCRCFQKSLQRNKDKPFCPYGKDCFYQHINDDGTPHIFKEGIDAAMRSQKYMRRGGPAIDDFTISLDFADFSLPADRSTRFTIRQRPAHTQPIQLRRHRRDSDRPRANGLNNATARQAGESSTDFDSLNTAFATIRTGWGRLDADFGDGGRRPDRMTMQLVEGMERLEILTDMLASIQVLRMTTQEEESERDGTETPPPLEPLEENSGPSGDITSDMPSPQFRWRENVDDGYESMPALESVSSDEDSGEDESLPRMSTAYPVECTQSNEQSSRRAAVERAEEVVEEADSGLVLESSTEQGGEPRSEPPFVTDGRGRVVWTSPAEEDKSSTEEQNGEPASRPEEATGSGGLLGWFNALF